jgi:hypothetical protein
MNQPRGRIISEWSTEGKGFLSTMLNKVWDEDDEEWTGGLPPKFVKSYEDVWLNWCKGEDNELAKAAFYQFTSRDEDTLMVSEMYVSTIQVHNWSSLMNFSTGTILRHAQSQQRSQKTKYHSC